jgi:hypothetical protein
MSGYPCPFSHLLTALSVTPSFSASADCDMPLFFLSADIVSPTLLASIGFSFFSKEISAKKYGSFAITYDKIISLFSFFVNLCKEEIATISTLFHSKNSI